MPEVSSNTMWAVVGASVSVVVFIAVVAVWAMQRFRHKLRAGRQLEGVRLVMNKSPYDPNQQVLVPTQVGCRRDSVADGMLAVLESARRSKSAECLPLEVESASSRVEELKSSKKFLSTTSLNIDIYNEESTQEDSQTDFSVKRSPYVEFTLLWTSCNSTFTVYVLRLTNLPPKYVGCSCSVIVKLVRPKITVSKTSIRLQNVDLNPEYSQVFTFADVSLQDLKLSDLKFEVIARRSGHLLNKSVGDLLVPVSKVNLEADKPATALEPLCLRKKDAAPDRNGRRASDANWGEIQVLAQYKETGSSQGRVKIVVLKAQSTLVNAKNSGEYHVEVIMRKGEEIQDVNTTKAALGLKPVWNAPFIFDVSQDKINEHWIELNLIRLGWTKRKATVGQAFLGLGTTPRGSQHWQSIAECPGREVTLWHPVVQEE
ncbi:synaptotagmin-10-like [Penaeus monodon]|uniref:synaptotagmin-10-like n=1 Tax=Penaeus monodon TaxID=6687 RepID=UPI0018A6D9B8|nr:synaptotagmin-10-like [Penaeus monodon]